MRHAHTHSAHHSPRHLDRHAHINRWEDVSSANDDALVHCSGHTRKISATHPLNDERHYSRRKSFRNTHARNTHARNTHTKRALLLKRLIAATLLISLNILTIVGLNSFG